MGVQQERTQHPEGSPWGRWCWPRGQPTFLAAASGPESGQKSSSHDANPPSPHTWLFPCQSAFSSRWWLVPILTRNYKRRNDSFIEVVVRPAHAAIGPKVIIYVKLFFLPPIPDTPSSSVSMLAGGSYMPNRKSPVPHA